MYRQLIIVANIILVYGLTGCERRNFTPEHYVSVEEQQKAIDSIVRYVAKLPPNATNETKFESQFDDYYKTVATDYDLRRYFIDKDSVHYLLVTRMARSIKPMRESIGLKIRYSHDGSLAMYEEVFRTWKMPDELMEKRYPVLFELMVEEKDLSEYYPKSKGDQYIEFPDGRFYFDVKSRRWRDQVMDSLNARE
jgi:hypothetical protein